MHTRRFLLMMSLLFSLFATLTTFARQTTDTIYFDESWSICERPVADYYRVCALNKIEQIYYKGTVTDYYINSRVEMTGQYDSKGSKKGVFTFYNRTGAKVKEGSYEGDKMAGLWSFYDDNGNLRAKFNCRSSTDFTPLLIINNRGDTVIKNGNGQFSFHSSTDLPGVFPLNKTYFVSGQV
ncbi:MAG: hypothetical protein M3040_12635, partial [Bacteroidota bacterium]|nr:hypothetical protein [Bacteroidota bacterium]